MTNKNCHHKDLDYGDILLIRANDFLEAMILFCDGDPDKVLEGTRVWMQGVEKQCEQIRKKRLTTS